MKNTATVHVIDDDQGVRNCLRMMLESPSLAVQAYESGEDFLNAGNPLLPGCMVADMRLPGMSGIDVLQRLRTANNVIPAIIISGHADLPAAIRSLKLGAIDLLQKPIERPTLMEAVSRGIQQSTELHLREVEREKAQNRLDGLTPRENQLLRLIVLGRSNKRIAVDLNIAFRTVINHRAHLMAKTQATNAADLTRLSMVAGILSQN